MVVDEDDNLLNDDSPQQSKKRKLSSYKKTGKVLGMDDEAAESGDEEGSDSEDEEDESNYVLDDFLVRDSKETNHDEDLLSFHAPKNKLKKLKKRKDEVQLDEEDELLIQESIMQNEEANAVDGSDYDDVDEEIAPTIVNDTNSRIAESAKRRAFFPAEEDDGSEMEGFIVHDGDDGDEESDEDHPRQHQQKVAHSSTQRRGGKRDGPTYDQIHEAMDIFGAGYDDFDDEAEEEVDEEDELRAEDGDEERLFTAGDADNAATEVTYKLSAKDKRLINKLRSRYERSQLVASFCTDRDEEIRRVDRPERFQSRMKGRGIPDEKERESEALWMAPKIAEKILNESAARRSGDVGQDLGVLCSELLAPIAFVLNGFQVFALQTWSPFGRSFLVLAG